ncbi:MAG TPA: HEAT repeat domain-containing protein [Gemmatimonadaceae bacterium]|nr:HEAT repeat domain-containing protein [Gemmatimonadaceae bacterium]
MTMKSLRLPSLAALVVLATVSSASADAQGLAARISQVRAGKVRFTFAPRADVCGYGNSISRGGNTRMNWSSDQSEDVLYDEECSHKPVRLVLNVENGRVVKLRTYVGGSWRTGVSGVTDLGAVSTREATDYLLILAATDNGPVGREAILPATLADSVVVWPRLFRIARDDDRPSSTRKQAIFWLGQAAGDRISPPETRFERRETEDEDVKKSAVFALSQRRNGEAVPALIQVARNNRDVEVRKAALFWLGQSADPRAISLFEEILR